MRLNLLLISVLHFSFAQSQTLPDLYQEVNSSVVVIDIISVGAEDVGSRIELVAHKSQGSGVLISSEGLIWTAAHVVQAAEEVINKSIN